MKKLLLGKIFLIEILVFSLLRFYAHINFYYSYLFSFILVAFLPLVFYKKGNKYFQNHLILNFVLLPTLFLFMDYWNSRETEILIPKEKKQLIYNLLNFYRTPIKNKELTKKKVLKSLDDLKENYIQDATTEASKISKKYYLRNHLLKFIKIRKNSPKYLKTLSEDILIRQLFLTKGPQNSQFLSEMIILFPWLEERYTGRIYKSIKNSFSFFDVRLFPFNTTISLKAHKNISVNTPLQEANIELLVTTLEAHNIIFAFNTTVTYKKTKQVIHIPFALIEENHFIIPSLDKKSSFTIPFLNLSHVTHDALNFHKNPLYLKWFEFSYQQKYYDYYVNKIQKAHYKIFECTLAFLISIVLLFFTLNALKPRLYKKTLLLSKLLSVIFLLFLTYLYTNLSFILSNIILNRTFL